MKAMLSTIINRLVPYIQGIPEGSASSEMLNFFARPLQDQPEIRRVAETGFNTGVSSGAFSSARTDTVVVWYDIGQHVSVSPANSAIDRRWPGRHQLIVGDSTQTLPAYARTHPETRFDLIFIDGGHDYDVAMADLVNFQALAHEHTIVVMDDLTPWWVWGQGRRGPGRRHCTLASLHRESCSRMASPQPR